MKKKIDSRVIAIIVITMLDVVYQLLPVDIIPDVAPVVGQIDDSVALLINVLTAIRLTTSQFKGTKEIAASEETNS